MRFITSSAAVSVVLLLACTEQTPPTNIPDVPLFNFANGPDEPGPVVVRLDGIEQGLIFWASGMSAWHGVDPRTGCLGEFYNDLWDFQVISSPDGPLMMLALGSDLITSVWPSWYGCDEYLNNEPLAEGTSHFERIDRWPGESNGARVHIWQAQGQLVTPTDEPAHYNGYSKWMVTKSRRWNYFGRINLR